MLLASGVAGLSAQWAGAQGPSAPAPAPAGAEPVVESARPVAFAVLGDRWAWIRHFDTKRDLKIAARGGGGATGADGDWSAVGGVGDSFFAGKRVGSQWKLVRIPAAGGEPSLEAPALGEPTSILGSGSELLVAELKADAAGDLLSTPGAGTRLSVRACTPDLKTLRTVVEIPSGMPVEAEPLSQDLLGVADGNLYLRVRRPLSTEFHRAPLAGGPSVRLAGEYGPQQGALFGGRLYWTASSEESGTIRGLRCVRTLAPDGATVTLTDWLPGIGTLTAVEPGGVRYVGDQVYAIPTRFGMSNRLQRAQTAAAATAGSSLVLFDFAANPVSATP